MKEYLLDMPYVVLFEIFRQLPKHYLLEISKLSSKFGDIARDTRLWKDVYIRHDAEGENLAFEELYSGPSPVKLIDLVGAHIQPPVSLETGQVVKVTELDLSMCTTDKVTMEAVWAKYQCTKLRLDHIFVEPHGHITALAPEAFSKQTALELLSLKGLMLRPLDMDTNPVNLLDIFQWLATVLSKYCKNLKTLDLSCNDLADLDLVFVKSLPTSLEKLNLSSGNTGPGDSFFQWLAERFPNLKELGVCFERVKCPALLKFKFLEALRIGLFHVQDIRDLYEYLIEFPALKNVYLDIQIVIEYFSKTNLEALRTKLKPHGISIAKLTGDLVIAHGW